MPHRGGLSPSGFTVELDIDMDEGALRLRPRELKGNGLSIAPRGFKRKLEAALAAFIAFLLPPEPRARGGDVCVHTCPAPLLLNTEDPSPKDEEKELESGNSTKLMGGGDVLPLVATTAGSWSCEFARTRNDDNGDDSATPVVMEENEISASWLAALETTVCCFMLMLRLVCCPIITC